MACVCSHKYKVKTSKKREVAVIPDITETPTNGKSCAICPDSHPHSKGSQYKKKSQSPAAGDKKGTIADDGPPTTTPLGPQCTGSCECVEVEFNSTTPRMILVGTEQRKIIVTFTEQEECWWYGPGWSTVLYVPCAEVDIEYTKEVPIYEEKWDEISTYSCDCQKT